ncbi:MAG: GNAT family N-acetyltransferase, partial [bacterium]
DGAVSDGAVSDGAVSDGAVSDGADAALLTALTEPRTMLAPASARFPAHLHIDLAASARGAGHGRALIVEFLTALQERGVPGVHLGVDPANTSAVRFYARLGFTALALDGAGPAPVYLSRPTWPPPGLGGTRGSEPAVQTTD